MADERVELIKLSKCGDIVIGYNEKDKAVAIQDG